MPRMNGSDDRAAVAVLGAGIMGSAIARNLAAAGLTTRVWDRTASATGPLADAGQSKPHKLVRSRASG